MNLLVDLGNTRLKWALEDRGTTIARGTLAHADATRVPALSLAWGALPAVAKICVASVAPLAVDVELEALARQYFGISPEFLRTPASALGIRNAYAEPERLGIDRFLGLAAAHAAHRRAQVVVSIGTAMTLDALDADGTHLGGWILPSPALMRDALLARTARVGIADGRVTEFADATADAVRSGTVNAATGAVERFRANAERRFATNPALVLTGGGADELAPMLTDAERRDDLVLDGLALWASSPEFVRGPR
ncbi:MAG TPA: type III pantothenate kinase [Rhodanobacteraceae bacterium]|jgi:type III pantothenate kinase|nr:type III pantothenate kinase [Rhodanobacteraceae bacterium]